MANSIVEMLHSQSICYLSHCSLSFYVVLALFVDQVNHCHPYMRSCLVLWAGLVWVQVFLPRALDDSPALVSWLFIGSQKTYFSRDLRGLLFYKYLAVLIVPEILPDGGSSKDRNS